MSGRWVRNFSMASSPLEPSATNFISGSALTTAARPLRRRGWSSTARMRIILGTLLISTRPLEQSESMPIAPLLVSHRSWNGQFHLSPRTQLAPETQVRTDALCPLAHPRYTKVAGLSAGQYLGVDPFAIVTHTQTKLILIVADLHFDVAGRGVCEGVPDHLTGDTVDLILQHRR